MGRAPRIPEPQCSQWAAEASSSAGKGAPGALLRLSFPRELGGVCSRAQYVATGPLCSLPDVSLTLIT